MNVVRCQVNDGRCYPPNGLILIFTQKQLIENLMKNLFIVFAFIFGLFVAQQAFASVQDSTSKSCCAKSKCCKNPTTCTHMNGSSTNTSDCCKTKSKNCCSTTACCGTADCCDQSKCCKTKSKKCCAVKTSFDSSVTYKNQFAKFDLSKVALAGCC